MALFKKIKTDIEDEPKKKEEKKEEKKKKEPTDWMQSKGELAVDVYETDVNFCIQAPVAGLDQEDIDIFIENDMLIIRGERTEPGDAKDKKYLKKECYWGPFSRQTILPEDVNVEKIKASFKKGILIVSVPKKKTEKKKVVINID